MKDTDLRPDRPEQAVARVWVWGASGKDQTATLTSLTLAKEGLLEFYENSPERGLQLAGGAWSATKLAAACTVVRQ